MSDRAKDLIPNLVRDLAPVEPVSLVRVFTSSLAVLFTFGAIALAAIGVRDDLASRATEPSFVVVAIALALCSALCASTAIRLATPGRDVARSRLALLFAVPIVLAIVVVVLAPWGGTWPGLKMLIEGCWSCIGVTGMSAAVPWVITVFMVSRLAPLRARRVGLFAGLSAFMLGALITELHCPYGDAYHLAVGHYLPIAVFSGLFSFIAASFIKMRSGASR